MISVLKGADTILQNDPLGLYVSLLSVMVVLSALIVLFFLIWGFGQLMVRSANKRGARPAKATLSLRKEEGVNAELIAAIGLALKLDGDERHDKESEIITLNKVARVYSPWSSKIHGLTQEPRR